jgi:hypothetical protein
MPEKVGGVTLRGSKTSMLRTTGSFPAKVNSLPSKRNCAAYTGLGWPSWDERLLAMVERIDLPFERVARDGKRRTYRLAGGLIQYKTIQGFPRLAASQAKPAQGNNESTTLTLPLF